MNCPECGQFMKLLIAFDLGSSPDEEETAYFWWCNDTNKRHMYKIDPIPAPEYDWLWWAESIPQEALDGWPELATEVAEMWARLPPTYKQKYKPVSMSDQPAPLG